jgi:hypothetical protein
MTGYVDLYGDIEYNAIVSVTARKMAEKVSSSQSNIFMMQLGQLAS